jgi:hypothetical protein
METDGHSMENCPFRALKEDEIIEYDNQKNSNGYAKLPGGIIIQWGAATTDNTVIFPIEFPNACMNVQATQTALSDHYENIVARSYTTTSFYLHTNAADQSCAWFAIGY